MRLEKKGFREACKRGGKVFVEGSASFVLMEKLKVLKEELE